MIRVMVWNEGFHEKENDHVREVYPNGIHGCIAEFLGTNEDIEVTTHTLYDAEEDFGLTEENLNNTDVLIWWGHMKHDNVPDELVKRVQEAVLKGMGIIFLHSAHLSKPFRALMGTTCKLCWRESGDMERVWVVDPAHPIAKGLDRYFNLPHEEMYGEPFGIPEPDKLVFSGWFSGGETFRSGCCWRRGHGKVFYFQPGHEWYPTYYDKNVQTVITNAVRWAYTEYRANDLPCPKVDFPESPVIED